MFEAFLGVNPWTALFILLNTLIVFLVARRYLFGPVMKIIRDRQVEIDSMYDAAEKANTGAKALEAEYTRKLSAAAETGERIVREAMVRAQTREEEILRQAGTEAAAILDKAVGDIAMEKRKAVNDAKDDLSDMALAIARKIVERELTVQNQSQLVDAFIKELGEQK